MTHRTSLNLDSKAQHIRLAEIAAELGFITSRGVGSGFLGNVSELNKAIAEGQVKVVKVENDDFKNKAA